VRTGGLLDLSRFDARRPDLRKPRRDEPATYRIRVDLAQARPPIWRRLEVRSDLTLDVVHQVLQAAYGWADAHLHRFALGGHPFDRHTQVFLCPYEVEEGEDEGLPAAEVRLDEALAEPGDVLRYAYDYGDSWDLTLKLEEVRPAAADSPAAVAVDGRRAAPPENCGGFTDADDLATVLDDPARFEVDEVNEALRSPYVVVSDHAVDPRVVDLMRRLALSRFGDEVAARVSQLVAVPHEPDGAALGAWTWFLDRAAEGGIPLTGAGYLRPADVEAASLVVPEMAGHPGKHNREIRSVPILRFRESLQDMGLLRKRKGVLLLTKPGVAAQRDPAQLWRHLASRLTLAAGGRFEQEAGLLLLLFAGTSPEQEAPLRRIAEVLTELGWQHPDGVPVQDYELYALPARVVLGNVTRQMRPRARFWISDDAAALARTALVAG
jgi:hypothetical protein